MLDDNEPEAAPPTDAELIPGMKYAVVLAQRMANTAAGYGQDGHAAGINSIVKILQAELKTLQQNASNSTTQRLEVLEPEES